MLWILLRGCVPLVGEAHAQWQHSGKPRSFLQGVCACRAHMLGQSDYGMPLAQWREKSQFLLWRMCDLGCIWTLNGCLERCPGAIFWGSGFMGPLCWSGVTRDWMPAARVVPCGGSEKHQGDAYKGSRLRCLCAGLVQLQ